MKNFIFALLLALLSLGNSSMRSSKAKHDFWKCSGYPHGRQGYVVDHIIPLACGGKDVPCNMQWQTIAAGKTKDKTERHCSIYTAAEMKRCDPPAYGCRR